MISQLESIIKFMDNDDNMLMLLDTSDIEMTIRGLIDGLQSGEEIHKDEIKGNISYAVSHFLQSFENELLDMVDRKLDGK